MNYFQAGYYLMKINSVNYGSIKDMKLATASTCINDSFFDSWSFDWAADGKDKSKIEKDYRLSSNQIEKLQNWVNSNFESKNIGWSKIFYSLDKINEYKQMFFNNRSDLIILGLSFENSEANDIIEEFKPQKDNYGELGLSYGLRQKVPENNNGKFLGYDIIGIESGGDFHTFHCHDLQNEFANKFDIEFNEYGLVENCKNWNPLTDYCNDESNGLEPVPWFYCKVYIYE